MVVLPSPRTSIVCFFSSPPTSGASKVEMHYTLKIISSELIPFSIPSYWLQHTGAIDYLFLLLTLSIP